MSGTDPGLEQERIIVTFRWIWRHTAACPLRTGVACCLPACAQGSSAAVTRVLGVWCFLRILGAPWSLVYMEGTSSAGISTHVYRTRVCEGVPVAGHALWAEVGGAII